jgi:hypothetical protein
LWKLTKNLFMKTKLVLALVVLAIAASASSVFARAARGTVSIIITQQPTPQPPVSNP